MATVQGKAQEALRYFQLKTREDGTKFWAKRENAPEWVKDLVFAAHEGGDFLPDDWRYAFLVEALDALADTEDPDDVQLEADVYNHELLSWLASHAHRPSFVDEHIEEHGYPGNIMRAIAGGQVKEKERVLSEVRDFLQEFVENEED